MKAARPVVAGALAALVLGGCSVRLGEPGDGPGEPIEAGEIPPVVPRDEPRSEHGNPESYVVAGERYHVRDSARGYVREGVASWYGRKFHGRRTSSGETYNMYTMSAAHRTLPLPTYVRVTNLENGRSAVVRVNDRGPFVDDRLIDLSYAAATRLGIVDHGTARVRVRALEPGDSTDGDRASAPADGDGGGDRDAAAGVFVQVGAFRHRENADSLRARLQGADIGPVRVQRARADSGTAVFRVRVGPLAEAGGREALLGRLRAVGIDEVRFITEW